MLRAEPGRVEILCGKGNNGGDGYVAARMLAAHGVAVRVHMTHPADALTPTPRSSTTDSPKPGSRSICCPRRSTIWGRFPIRANVAPPTPNLRAPHPDGSTSCGRASLCIDALVGTGIREPLRGRLAALVDTLNRCSRRTLAVDLPSGIDADTGEVQGTSVWADATVTFGLPKLGLALHPGASAPRHSHCRHRLPTALIEATPRRFWVDRELVAPLLPRLEPTAHKYSRGTVLVLAGSREFPGAASLVARAALRAGAGMVHVVVPASMRNLMQAKLTEVIVHGGAETSDGTLARIVEPWFKKLLDRSDAWAVGPGIGTAAPTLAWIRDLLRQVELPAVVDADAIRRCPRHATSHRASSTPHAGELWRWIGVRWRRTPNGAPPPSVSRSSDKSSCWPRVRRHSSRHRTSGCSSTRPATPGSRRRARRCAPGILAALLAQGRASTMPRCWVPGCMARRRDRAPPKLSS
jgi:NAD(P)H-hydrate epimerase